MLKLKTDLDGIGEVLAVCWSGAFKRVLTQWQGKISAIVLEKQLLLSWACQQIHSMVRAMIRQITKTPKAASETRLASVSKLKLMMGHFTKTE